RPRHAQRRPGLRAGRTHRHRGMGAETKTEPRGPGRRTQRRTRLLPRRRDPRDERRDRPLGLGRRRRRSRSVSEFAAIASRLGVNATTGEEALSRIADTMRQKSADLDVLMIFMRRTGASIYSLSKHSGLSVSAVRGRLASAQAQARLKDTEGQARDSDYAVVDLTRLSPAARAEVEASLSDGDSPDI